MLDGFEETNVRGLIDIADRIATKVASGVTPEAAVDEIFRDRYDLRPETSKDTRLGIADRVTQEMKLPGSLYFGDKDIVASAYHDIGPNVSHIEQELRDKNVNFSRRKISRILDDLGFPREKRKR